MEDDLYKAHKLKFLMSTNQHQMNVNCFIWSQEQGILESRRMWRWIDLGQLRTSQDQSQQVWCIRHYWSIHFLVWDLYEQFCVYEEFLSPKPTELHKTLLFPQGISLLWINWHIDFLLLCIQERNIFRNRFRRHNPCQVRKDVQFSLRCLFR